MKVFIRNKFMSLTGASKVLNENKEPIYKVKGKFLSIRKKKRICDLDGNVLYRVQNKMFNWIHEKAYILNAKKQRIATVTKRALSKAHTYVVEDFKDEILVDGQFFSRECNILINDKTIGSLKRELSFVEDHFVLDVEYEDIPFLIAMVIAIDNITDRKSKRTK